MKTKRQGGRDFTAALSDVNYGSSGCRSEVMQVCLSPLRGVSTPGLGQGVDTLSGAHCRAIDELKW